MFFFENLSFFQFRKINFPVDYMELVKKHFKLSFLVLSMVHPLTALSFYLDGSIVRVPLVLYASLYFSMSIGSVSGYTLGVFYRLRSINKILQYKLSFGREVTKVLNNEKEEQNIYVGLTNIYTDIMGVCDSINLCFGCQMMLGFGTVFFFTILTTFSAYTDIINAGYLNPTTISSITFCIYYNLFLASVIHTCNMLTTEVCLKFNSLKKTIWNLFCLTKGSKHLIKLEKLDENGKQSTHDCNNADVQFPCKKTYPKNLLWVVWLWLETYFLNYR